MAETTRSFVIVLDRRRRRGQGEVMELKSHDFHYYLQIIEIEQQTVVISGNRSSRSLGILGEIVLKKEKKKKNNNKITCLLDRGFFNVEEVKLLFLGLQFRPFLLYLLLLSTQDNRIEQWNRCLLACGSKKSYPKIKLN